MCLRFGLVSLPMILVAGLGMLAGDVVLDYLSWDVVR
jgi:hypothetical protein